LFISVCTGAQSFDGIGSAAPPAAKVVLYDEDSAPNPCRFPEKGAFSISCNCHLTSATVGKAVESGNEMLFRDGGLELE
jgi:hypothetical protein